MLKKYLRMLILLAILTASQNVKASHISGGDITFQCVGPNQYLITLNLFRDCAGISMSNSEFMTASSPCGSSINFTAQLQNPGGTNISQLCPPQIPNSTCSGGTLPGMQLYTYQATVTLNPPCDTWTVSWSTCCRNNIVNLTNSSAADVYLQATLNTLSAPCNNSPVFTAQPIPYVCANQPVSYNYGIVEPDGDSLVYSFVSAMANGATLLPYTAGYSGALPLPGITIDPITGQMNFTPTVLGNFVVVVQVNEYNKTTGALMSTVMRDIQFVVLSCTNTPPDINAGAITNLTGNAVQTSPNSVDICEGNTFSFVATYTDTDINDSLFIANTNIASVLPGATYTVSGTNPLVVTYNWTVPPGSAGQNTIFTVTIRDNACPVYGLQTFVYDINVLDRTLAWPDQIICGTQQAQLNASGGNIFTWYDMNNNLIPVGPQFSCNPCANPVAQPTVTTSYVVESNLVGSCINRDTVTVTIAPDFTYTITQSSNSACLFEPLNMSVTPLPAGNYSYAWTPANVMSNPAISNPVANFVNPGTFTVGVTVTSPNGCQKQDSLTFTIAPNAAPTVTAISDTVCQGDFNQLDVIFGNTIPVACGTTSVPCGSATSIGTIGTGTASNTNTSYPAVFGNFWWGARHQILYTAADLQAMGFIGGKITQIGFEIVNLNGSTIQHNAFTIRMGCTNLTQMTNNWQGGLQTVYGPVNHNVTLGWNMFTLSNIFEWDGQSNIIVETCFNNSSWVANCSGTYSVTPVPTVTFYNADIGTVCSSTNTSFNSPSPNRPNIRIAYCAGVADPTLFTYEWTPSNFVSDPSIINPVTTTTVGQTYTVVVTAINGGCTDTSSVTVNNLIPPGNADITIPPSTFFCIADPAYQLVSATPGGDWSGPGVDPVTGLFTPANAGVGNHEIIYSIIGSASCYTSDTLYLDVAQSPNASINYGGPTTVCETAGTVQLTSVVPGGSWSGTAIDPQTGLFDPIVSGAGTFDLVYTLGSGNCISYDTIAITVVSPPDQSLIQQAPLCLTDPTVTLQAATPGGQWNGPGITNTLSGVFDPATAGTGFHTIVYNYGSTCPFNNSMVIQVKPPPAQPLIANNTPICEGITLEFVTGAVQNATYNWSGPDGFTSNAQNPSVPSVTLANAGNYSLVVTVDGCNSLPGNSLADIIPTPPTPVVSSNSPICEGELLQLTTDDYPNAFFLWSGPSGYSSTLREPVIPYALASMSGIYYVVKQANGCVSPQGSVEVTVNPKPTAFFIANPPVVTDIDPDIQFINQSTPNLSYLWNFGDNNTSTDFAPNHTYQDTGFYNVLLNVLNAQTGCENSYETIIEVAPYYTLYVPTAFTPNGDNLNDVFKISGNAVNSFLLEVYDRWGQLMFRTNNIDIGWDGTTRGTPSPQGAYIYRIEVSDVENKMKKYTGSVTLIR
jgi:gliding motility-associated-like protein